MTTTRVVVVVPPSKLTEPTPVPELRKDTIGAGQTNEKRLESALEACNINKQSMAEYINDRAKKLAKDSQREN